MNPVPPFPEHLRRSAVARGRYPRRTWPAVALVAAAAVAALWRVREVRLVGGEVLPPAARAEVAALVGRPLLLVDPDAVRSRLERYSGVARVGVRWGMDGTVAVTVERARAAGSIRVGRGWHGVTAAGRPCGRLERPRPPVLEGAATAAARREALAAAARVTRLGLGRVTAVCRLLPGVVAAYLEGGGEVRLADEPTRSERWLGRRGAGAVAGAELVDLTRDDRIVVRRGASG